ncbi:MAG: hypothetical protein WBM50_22630 [Acidimicrobiales bacterium]
MILKRLHTGGLTATFVAFVLATAACGSGEDSSATSTTGGDQSGEPIELSLGDGAAIASCPQFDIAVLADMSPAFAGTVTSVEGETVTLSIDRWYTGGDAATATLLASSGMEALIGGIDFQTGQQYLITAAGGNVNYCGYSGPADVELTAAFDEAFGS